MTSKIVVNNIEPDACISTVTVNGDCQATTFKGDGSNLTGIDASSIKFGGAVKVQANNSGAVVSGILTVNQDNDRTTFMTGNSVGVGTTNTAGRNAGVSTAAGTVIFNATTQTLEFYTGNTWVATNLIPTINSVTGQILNTVATNIVLNVSNNTDTVSVKYSNNSTSAVIATVANQSVSGSNVTTSVPAAVYNSSSGTVVKIELVNSDGTISLNAVTLTVTALPTGGTKTTAGGYTYHTFTSSGDFVNTIASLSTEFLLVAGGGGGGSGDNGGGGGSGGGAGGAIDGTATLGVATYPVVIGAGGQGGQRNQGQVGANGSNSTFNGNTSIGGGRGVDDGQDIVAGQSGGSGGGGFRAGTGGAGTSGQGNAGGNGGGNSGGGGGGGGKGSAGGNAGNTGGNGGSGINWKSLGSSYAGGGGGGGSNSGGGGSGSAGGGNGTASGTTSNNSDHANANTGSGGGGTGGNSGSFYIGSNGASGIAIIRYQL